MTTLPNEEYLTKAVLDTGAQLNVISQKSALMWNLPRLEGTPGKLEMANNTKAYVYGYVGMVFRMRDAWGQTKTLKATLWAIDREDHHPILGIPLLKREGLHLDLATGEFRFGI